MFVAVSCDFSNEDHRDHVSDLLIQYGFKQVMEGLFESTTIPESHLARLKKDIDSETDSYDIIRIYQYPFEDTLVISALERKKWRKMRIVV
ncbi:MAG: CRISPR-associated protein Cas2 [Spirochaetales bacterium]|nr:CRISPR-associated protein Cas2 [Spirochaetales bacterium]